MPASPGKQKTGGKSRLFASHCLVSKSFETIGYRGADLAWMNHSF